ncbi:MAG: hypothetical protein MR809_10025 [Rikenellaceae bacterium]|nr:hypothetical protein [Rikenellaceae bacterium]
MKISKFFMAACTALAFLACTKEIDSPSTELEGNDPSIEGATFYLTASHGSSETPVSSSSDAESKALFDGWQLVWNNGDSLNVFINDAPESYGFKFEPTAGAAWNKQGKTFYTCEFKPEETGKYNYTAVFPFTKGLTMGDDGYLYKDGVKKTWSIETPTQKRNGNKVHLEAMPLLGQATATGTDVPALTMKNLVSVIEVETKNNLTKSNFGIEVLKIKFSCDAMNFGGEYYINTNTGALELKEGTAKHEITLTCQNINNDGTHIDKIAVNGSAWNHIAIAPQTVTGTLNVEVLTNYGVIKAQRQLTDVKFNAGRFRTIRLSLEEAALNYFVKAEADGTGDGKSWEKAFNINQFLDFIMQKGVNKEGVLTNQEESDNNAREIDGHNFHFAAGTYNISARKLECSGYEKRVEFNVLGGYPASNKGTDLSGRDIVANKTIFDGQSKNRLFTLGNQMEPTFDGIKFSQLFYNQGDGCITLAAGVSGDSRANFKDCIFKSCTGSGAADNAQMPVILIWKGMARFNNVLFDGCRAEKGPRGLIRLGSGDSRAYMNACRFVNCTWGGFGYGLLAHINHVGGNLCLHNVTFANNDKGCWAQGVINGTGGMLIASSTIVASNDNPAIRCESDPNSGSLVVNSIIRHDKDKSAINMSATERKLKSLGGNIIIGAIDGDGVSGYEKSERETVYSNRAAASALDFSWNDTPSYYWKWNGTTSFTKLSKEEVREAIKSYSNSNTGKLYAGSTVVYDGAKAGEDFLNWLDSINAFDADCYGNTRDASAFWPGSYQGN